MGRYGFSDGSSGVVTLDERGLIVTFDKPTFRGRLHPASPTEFTLRAVEADVRFGGSGAGATMTVSQDGVPPDVGKRLP